MQADLRAFHAYSLHGCTVFAALTAQNPHEVSAIHPVPADFVKAQLDAVLGVYDIRALKTGMLSDPAAIEVIAERISVHDEIAKVIDPVMIATSGARLISEDAMCAVKSRLLTLATLMTPNLPEAEELCGCVCDADTARMGSVDRARDLAKELFDDFGCAVLVKGGHGAGSSSVDVLFDGEESVEFSMPRIDNPVSTHGTGCSLAAALASELALGHDLKSAVAGAKAYVHDAIERSYLVGPDCGVLGFAPRQDVALT